MPKKRQILIPVLLLLAAFGCGKGRPQAKPVEKLEILATVYPLGDVARQIGGDCVRVAWAIEAGQSIESTEPTADIRNRMRSADLVIGGGESEPWAMQALSDRFRSQHVICLDALNASSQPTEYMGLSWLDPVLTRQACRELCTRASALRPECESGFRERTDHYVTEIDALLSKYQPKFALASNRKLLVLSSDFNGMLQRFGLVAIPTVTASPMRLSDSDVRNLKQTAKQQDTHLLIIPADTPAVVARDLEIKTGLQLVQIDALGSSGTAGRNSYLNLLRFNLEQLLRATTFQ